MTQTYKQVCNCLDLMLERINKKAKAIDVLVKAKCIEEAVSLAIDMSQEATSIKTMLMEFDLNS